MKHLNYTNNIYRTSPDSRKIFAGLFPSFSFYVSLLANVYFSSLKARKGLYDNETWQRSSLKVLHALEHTGLTVELSGIEHLRELDSPCVIIGNHMSMMETLVLPAFILPEQPVTFAVKQSLLDYPVFKHVMRSRNPIAVTRSNPRQDLKTIINEGKDRLQKGISVIIFPQTTRGTEFEPKQFNSIGVKLALRAGAPVLPLALKTDAPIFVAPAVFTEAGMRGEITQAEPMKDEDRLEELNQRLKAAVEAEEYEEAARLRDEIKSMEKEMKGKGN